MGMHPTENETEERVRRKYENDGNRVEEGPDPPDLIVDTGEEELRIEVKGNNSSGQDRVDTAIGQVIRSRDSKDENWAIIFPADREEKSGKKPYQEYFDDDMKAEMKRQNIDIGFASENNEIVWLDDL